MSSPESYEQSDIDAVKTLMSMCASVLMNNGVSKETFVSNIRMFANCMTNDLKVYDWQPVSTLGDSKEFVFLFDTNTHEGHFGRQSFALEDRFFDHNGCVIKGFRPTHWNHLGKINKKKDE